MQQSDSILSLRDILKIIFKRKRLIAGVFLVALLTSIILSFLMPPTFESTATILVRRSNLETEEPQIGASQQGAPTSYRHIAQADEMNTAISVLRSRDLVIAAIDRIALTKEQFYRVRDFRRYVRSTWLWIGETLGTIWKEVKYFIGLSRRSTPEEIRIIKRERFVDLVYKAVVVEQVPDSDVLRVGLRVSDPVLAKRFAETLSELALAWHDEKFRQSGNFSFFGAQVKKAGGDLERLEKELALTRQELNLISIEDQRLLIIKNRFQSQADLNGIYERIAGIKAGISKINAMIADEPSTATLTKEIEINPLWEQISRKITELELSRIDNAAKHSKESRVLSDIDATLKGWNTNLNQMPPKRESVVVKGINSIHQAIRMKRMELEAEMAILVAEARQTEQTIDAHDLDLKRLNEGSYRIADLERRVHTQATVYQQYLKDAELARIAEAKQQARLANLNIIQAPPLPVRAFKPRKRIIILIAGACGLLFGIAWAFAVEMNDTSLDSEADIRRHLSAEPLVTIEHQNPNSFRPDSIHGEVRRAVKSLYDKISRSCKHKPLAVAFVSSRTGEGTTTLMVQTALAAASESKRVLMIDASPDASLTKWFGFEGKKGLYDFRDGVLAEEIIQSTDQAGLFVVPAGKSSGKTVINDWIAVIEALKKRADIIFADLGAIDNTFSYPELMSGLGGVVLVSAAHITRRETVQQTIAELQVHKSLQLLGVVLNRRRFFVPEFLYRNT